MRKAMALTLTLAGLSQALELKTDLLGKLNLSGAITGYMLHSNNTSDTRKTRYDVGSAIISLSKSAEPIGFTIVGGAYATPVVGVGLLKTSDYTDLFSALPVAYLELAPMKGLSLQAGKLPTLIGYEVPFTYQNNYIQRGLIWNMQPVVHHGVRAIYNTDLFSVKLGVNDGFYTLSTDDAKPAVEGSIGLTPIKDASLSLNFLIPSKSSKPNDTAVPANKREFNAIATFSIASIALGADLMYVEAPEDADAGVPAKAKASGGALHLSYSLEPFKLSGRVEYFKDNTDAGGTDLVGLGDGNKGWTITFTPSYSKGPLFARAEVSYVKADQPFTVNGKKNQTRFGIEVGFLF
ncbi:MAG: porin [Acidobacteria bacterium]|jgi:hypothetical protein|nr:MAG: porin [Acidobacteriota bacterium]